MSFMAAMSFMVQFDGPAREELQQVAAQFCSYQSIALGLIKTKQRKESRFQLFMQVHPPKLEQSWLRTAEGKKVKQRSLGLPS